MLRSTRNSPAAPVATIAAAAALAAAIAAPAPAAAAERPAGSPPPRDAHHALLPASPPAVPAGDRVAVPTPGDVASPAGAARRQAGRARIADGSTDPRAAAAHTPRARAPPGAGAPTARAALRRDRLTVSGVDPAKPTLAAISPDEISSGRYLSTSASHDAVPLITHDQSIARRLRRLVRLRDGRIIDPEDAAEVAARSSIM